MPINQLFRQVPPIKLINDILLHLGHNGIEDRREFNKFLFTEEIIKKMTNSLDCLSDYYIPSKKNIYMSNIDAKKMITIIKQILRPHNYKLISKEKFVKEYNKKITIYTIEDTRPKRPNTTLSFD